MKHLIVALLIAAVLSGAAWSLAATLPLGGGTVESGSSSLDGEWGRGWSSIGSGTFEYFGPP